MKYRCAQEGFNIAKKQGYRHSLQEKSIPYVVLESGLVSSPEHYNPHHTG